MKLSHSVILAFLLMTAGQISAQELTDTIEIKAGGICGDILIGKIAVPVSDSYRKEVDGYVRNNLLSR